MKHLPLIAVLTLTTLPLVFFRGYVDSYALAKWAYLALVSVALALKLIAVKKLVLPRLPREQWFLGFLLLLLTAQGVWRFGFADQLVVIAERCIFWLWFVVFYQILRQTWDFAQALARGLLVPTFLVAFFGFLQWLQIPVPFLPASPHGMGSLWGNLNICAEFLAYGCIILLLAHRFETRLLRVLGEGTVGIALTVNFALACRTTSIGLACAVIYAVAVRAVSWQVIARVLVIGVLFFQAPFFLAPTSQANPAPFGANPLGPMLKKSFISQRLGIWQDTLLASWHHPAGVGAGHFSFGHIPETMQLHPGDVQEFKIWEHPHNELLRFLVEEGWSFTFILIVLMFMSARMVMQRMHGLMLSDHRKFNLLITLGIIAGASASFSFPLLSSFNFLMIALITALALNLGVGSRTISVGRSITLPFGLVAGAIILSYAYRIDFAQSSFQSLRFAEAPMARACDLLPSHWQLCLAAIENHIHHGHFAEAEARLNRILSAEPWHYPAMRLRGKLASAQGNHVAECTSLTRYDAILSGSSSLTERKQAICLINPRSNERIANPQGYRPR